MGHVILYISAVPELGESVVLASCSPQEIWVASCHVLTGIALLREVLEVLDSVLGRRQGLGGGGDRDGRG